MYHKVFMVVTNDAVVSLALHRITVSYPMEKTCLACKIKRQFKKPCIRCLKCAEDFSNQAVRSWRCNVDSGTVYRLAERRVKDAATLTGCTDCSARKTVLHEAKHLLAYFSLTPMPSYLQKWHLHPQPFRLR